MIIIVVTEAAVTTDIVTATGTQGTDTLLDTGIRGLMRMRIAVADMAVTDNRVGS